MNQIDQSIRIINALEAPFSLDLIVRTPKRLQRDWEDGDWFLREVLAKGKILYEKTDGEVGAEGRRRSDRRKRLGSRTNPHFMTWSAFIASSRPKSISRALLQDVGLVPPRTHDLVRPLEPPASA